MGHGQMQIKLGNIKIKFLKMPIKLETSFTDCSNDKNYTYSMKREDQDD